MQSGELDAICPASEAVALYERVSSTPRMLVEIAGGNHVGFNDSDIAELAVLLGFDAAADIDIDEQHRLSARYFTAWLNVELKLIEEYEEYLFGALAWVLVLLYFTYAGREGRNAA